MEFPPLVEFWSFRIRVGSSRDRDEFIWLNCGKTPAPALGTRRIAPRDFSLVPPPTTDPAGWESLLELPLSRGSSSDSLTGFRQRSLETEWTGFVEQREGCETCYLGNESRVVVTVTFVIQCPLCQPWISDRMVLFRLPPASAAACTAILKSNATPPIRTEYRKCGPCHLNIETVTGKRDKAGTNC
jgi:hypothetical protein